MKSQSPALSQSSLVSTAGRKAHKVQRKLQQAEAELHSANEVLVQAKEKQMRDKQALEVAVKQNVAAEEKVHDAAEDLKVVKELLAEANAESHGTRSSSGSPGQSGDGLKSLIQHLERNRSGATE